MKNSVELLGYYGSDETHALSAWTSTKRELNDDKRGRIDKLLRMLADNGHHTPFEKSALHFLVTSEVASHIHIIKHRIGVSVNAESARYKELKDDRHYTPVDWPDELREDFEDHIHSTQVRYHRYVEELVASGFTRARAKESARFILPYATQLTSDVMFNWRSFATFLGLRNTQHAQLEVRTIAKQMLSLIEAIPEQPFKLTIAAFREAGLLGES